MSPINRLPPEMLKEVLKKLDLEDLGEAALVCKAWREAAEDPALWKNFPVRLTPSNWDSFLEMKRLAKAEYVEVELPSCNKIGCEVHPQKEWPVLDKIKTFLGTNLKEMIIRLSQCAKERSGGWEWIRDFAFKGMDDGITTCVILTPIDEDVWARYFFYWGENTASTSLFNLMRKTIRDRGPGVGITICGGPDNRTVSRHIPDLFEMLDGLMTEDGLFFLKANVKMTGLKSTDHLKQCYGIHLFNMAALEEDEVQALHQVLAHLAQEPRPTYPSVVYVPKALFLRTALGESMALRRWNMVACCEDEGEVFCKVYTFISYLQMAA